MTTRFIVTYLSGIKNDGEMYSDCHLRARQKCVLGAHQEEVARTIREAEGLHGDTGEWVLPGAVLSIRRA